MQHEIDKGLDIMHREMETRFERVDKRFERVDKRFDEVTGSSR